MKSIIFGFSRPKTWKPYAEAIMAVDKINYDHAYTRFVSPRWECSFIYQSSGHRTNFMGDEYFFKNNIAVEEYELFIDDATEASVGKLMVEREGIPYAILQVIGKGIVVLAYICSFGKIKISNPFKGSDNKTDCIEEQALLIAKAVGIAVPLDMNTVTVKPYRDFIASLPGIKRKV